jgi:hypothetical protein
MPWQIAQQHKGCFSFWIMSAESKSPFGINACQHKRVVLNNGAEIKQRATCYKFMTLLIIAMMKRSDEHIHI